MRTGVVLVSTLALVACGSSPQSSAPNTVVVGPADSGSPSIIPSNDAGSPDAGAPPDAGAVPDAGVDAGTLPDAGVAGPLGGGDWGQYRHDQHGASENPATFAASEVPNLFSLWNKDLGDSGATTYFYTQPVIASDMVVFTTAASGKVVAVDPNTGGVLWTQVLNSPIVTSCGGSKSPGIWASAAIVGDVVYVASPDGNVYALHKSDGSTIWAAKVADPGAAGHGEFIQSSPAVSTALGKLYVGVASSAGCDEVAGRIASVDLANGSVQQQALVGPGQQGAAVWSSISVAEDEGRIYVTTGNVIGPLSATPNSQAFLAMDAHSLAVLDHWQDPTPLIDSDFGASPTLAEGGGMKLVAATNKDGWLYVLNRNSLHDGPVWKYQMAIVDPANPTRGGDAIKGWGSLSTPAFAHGRLYAAGGRTPQGEPGSVIAFDPATGAQLWPQKHVTPGYVIAPVAVAGEILVVVSSTPDPGSVSTLEILDAASGALLRSFPGAIATYGGPSIGHGLILWTDAFGHTSAFAAKDYRP